MIKKFWLLLLLLVLFSAGCLAVVILTSASFIGLFFGVIFAILAVCAFCLVKTVYSEIQNKIKEEETNGQKKTKRLFSFSFAVVVSIIIAIGAIVEIGFGFRVKNLADDPVDKEVCGSVLVINNTVSSLRWNEKVCFFQKSELKKLNEKCDKFIATEAKRVSDEISELKPLKKIKSSEHNKKIEDKIFELELEDDDVFEAKVKEHVSNYSDLEKYKNTYSKLLENYKVNCYSCGGDGRLYCSTCAGDGKCLVTWYSHGDWGETSYSSYTCTSCNGTGKKSCSSCSGRGYSYVFN